MTDRFLTTKEAARLIGYSHRTLEDFRYRGGGPEFIELRSGRKLYSERVLIEWVRSGGCVGADICVR